MDAGNEFTDWVLGSQETVKHIQGQHDQKTHGFRGGSAGEGSFTEAGIKFETGKPVSFTFMRNTEKAPRATPDDRFEQKVEPAGKYVLYDTSHGKSSLVSGWIRGQMTMKSPIVIRFGQYRTPTSWKQRLSAAYGGKTGKALSRAILKSGHDGIITYNVNDRGEAWSSEIVDLSVIQ